MFIDRLNETRYFPLVYQIGDLVGFDITRFYMELPEMRRPPKNHPFIDVFSLK